MDEILGMLKTTAPALGVPRVLAPGEPEREAEMEHRRLGVPYPGGSSAIDQTGERLGVSFPACRRPE